MGKGARRALSETKDQNRPRKENRKALSLGPSGKTVLQTSPAGNGAKMMTPKMALQAPLGLHSRSPTAPGQIGVPAQQEKAAAPQRAAHVVAAPGILCCASFVSAHWA